MAEFIVLNLSKNDGVYLVAKYIDMSTNIRIQYTGANKSLARPTSWCILFDG
jgi:hypothetical protein